MRLRLEPEEYKALCLKVLERDGFRCRNPRCQYRNNLSVHHVVYRSEQGEDSSWNLLTLCEKCHDAIHKTHTLYIAIAEGNHVGPGGGTDGELRFIYA